ncbi:MAG TPA: anaerobic ribonucleoside-triphosphate reductase activating protein [Epulopiscium sp.]|nr:anaerobic ribonucleoside-triphosphate reductase activating protein [Candidatus Epulonipiscium sp.]
MKTLQLAGFLDNSTVNGEGLRSVVFLSGCYHDCPGCHNGDMQNLDYGESLTHNEIITRIKNNMPIIKGVTISGGEPFLQYDNLLPLLEEIRFLSLDCWVYTGYTYEQLLKDSNFKQLLPWIDVLVEGPFVQDLLTTDLPYIGSTNQIILKLANGLIQEQLHFN